MQTLPELYSPFCPAREEQELLLHPFQHTAHRFPLRISLAHSLSLYCRFSYHHPLLLRIQFSGRFIVSMATTMA